ncbi:YbbR-like domain-containing protein [Tamlana sp. 2_MG-2023]|uniref:YbbR-like domain-containing protein n=1 Tax=unclassified Tamlana TaxID=2614803 RepID=UPI0026E17202|nr:MULTISPECIES: YbbR-like domain-containing protein [unclassified Tamlana]MDO6759109.1 YbbR-like domain-containing protein [Tamlana sp. 2_MG-2023]MDO6789808.1 YbbR-like domain-containing protein [Tamlana sp. 1_MG-2023]
MLNKLRSKILSSIKNKRINVFLVFLLSAFVILIISKLSKSYTDTIPFKIQKVNIPQEYVILDDSVNMDITLKTHGFRWLKYYFTDPKVTVDFTNDVHKEKDVFVYNKTKAFLKNTQFDKEVELLNLAPERITFRYGVNLVKKVPVRIKADVNYSLGYNASTDLVVEPDSVVVVGADILVSKIKFLETEAKQINGVRANLDEPLLLKLPENKSDLDFSTTTVRLKATVEKFTEGTLKIPVRIINAPKKSVIKFFPKEVSVSYYVSLSDFEQISKKDFEVICDFSDTSEDQTFLIPELVKAPELAKYSKINQQRVEFIISK